MPTPSALRMQIESALADRIPSALTPQPRTIRQVLAIGILSVDEILTGGLPVGAITEAVGPECSGRTALGLSFMAQVTKASRVCAWIDTSDCFHPESAAAAQIDLKRLLWVRCGVPSSVKEQRDLHKDFSLAKQYLIPKTIKRSVHGGGLGSHPRSEVKGLSDALSGFLSREVVAPQHAGRQLTDGPLEATLRPVTPNPPTRASKMRGPGKPLSRIGQALSVADLLLQAGGFSAIVLDLGSIAPEDASRVPLATWYRYRAAAERTQTSILLLTQYACAKSSAGLVLRMQTGSPLQDEKTVFTGIEHEVVVARERFGPAPSNVIPLRKPPQSEKNATWHSRTTWLGRR